MKSSLRAALFVFLVGLLPVGHWPQHKVWALRATLEAL